MSKAFTKEDDGSGEDDALPSYVPPWPPGSRNYISAEGHARLRAEHDALVTSLPSLITSARNAAPVDGPTAKGNLREARRRLQQLDVHLEVAEIVPIVESPMRVQLGATVTVRGDRDAVYTIVGVDEVDVAHGRISWLSPLARALSGTRVGERVSFRTRKGEEELEVVEIR
ncbi:MAG: GreA/GreB family elongation factor [Polyangia bacterium]